MYSRVRLLVLLSVLAGSLATHAAPSLIYSTYLLAGYPPNAIATDPAGNIYLVASSPVSFPNQILVVKLNPQGDQYLYVRHIGGTLRDLAYGIAVDAAGDAYVAGYTTSPDFPVTGEGNLGTPVNQYHAPKSFVFKLDPEGNLVFSDLLGGPASSMAQAVAVNANGQIIVTGEAGSSNFPVTPGAHSVPDPSSRPYLLVLDPTGTKVLSSATGIGGTALALDAAGNIYVAGTTLLLDYPTTPGSYQPTLPKVRACYDPACPLQGQGPDQYVSKIDPTGANLIYSTSLSGPSGTINQGLAVDAAGNAYVTGFARQGYPYTVAAPALSAPLTGQADAAPFLTKLDPLGKSLLFSVPVGGFGVAANSTGAVSVGGIAGTVNSPATYVISSAIPALSGIPAACLPNGITVGVSAYAALVDETAGTLLGTQFLGGSSVIPSSIALAGSTLWLAGTTQKQDVPMAGSALTVTIPQVGNSPGAYLAAVDFSQPATAPGTPRIDCVLDAADLVPVGPVAVNQLLSIFGEGLGPAQGVNAGTTGATTLGGVSIAVGSSPAPILYASANQINFAVPSGIVALPGTLNPLRVTVNGATESRVLVSGFNPSLFWNLPGTFTSNSGAAEGFALALNADGSINSESNPAAIGSVVSVFVNGDAPDPTVVHEAVAFYANGWQVTNIAPISPYVYQVDVRLPLTGGDIGGLCFESGSCAVPLTLFQFNSTGPGFTAAVWTK